MPVAPGTLCFAAWRCVGDPDAEVDLTSTTLWCWTVSSSSRSAMHLAPSNPVTAIFSGTPTANGETHGTSPIRLVTVMIGLEDRTCRQ